MCFKLSSLKSLSPRVLVTAGALLVGACASQAEPLVPPPVEDAGGRNKQLCGGIAGLRCPEGYACIDDPSDTCDPSQGGADCGGICVKDKPKCKDPSRAFVSRDPEQCAAIRFFCQEGQAPFFDECGCGCEPAP